MARVIIVRHGQSTYNQVKRIQGRTDVSRLTPKGCDDARKVGKALQNISVDAMHHSPLGRAKETANIIYQELRSSSDLSCKPQASEKLKEIHLPAWEGLLSAEAQQKFPQDYRIWQETPHKLSMFLEEEGVTKEYFPVLALYEQARLFWQDILSLHPLDTVLIVAHNGINRALISTALGIDPRYYQSIQQSNCCINILNFSGGLSESVELESLNQTQHMGDLLPPLRPNHQGVRLLLVRHGETEWNLQKRFQGATDISLNENGKQQSEKIANFLKEVSLDFATSSPLKRSVETAEMILQYHSEIELKLQEGLQEVNHGLWQGKTETEVEEEFPAIIQCWRNHPQKVQMPNGENLEQVWERIQRVWQNLIENATSSEDKLIGLVVAHGAINKALICHILGLSPESFWNFRQSNGSISVIDYPSGMNGLPVLQGMNITAYLNESVLDTTSPGAS
ncbi:MAG: histidine phosphatase family protein [Cyanobacteria bacterium P01_A01_bin.84]